MIVYTSSMNSASIQVTQHPVQRTEADFQRIGLLLFALFSVAYFALAINVIPNMRLGTDEVFVLWMVRDVPASQIVHGVSRGLEWLPPTYYMFLKMLGGIFGVTPATLRMPSVAGFYITLVTIFLLLRKRVSYPVAALAAVIPCLTEAGLAAFWARPYTIMTACFSLSLLLWANMHTERSSAWRAAGIACLITLAICVHFNSVFFVIALGAMELVRTIRTRKVRWHCWIAFVMGGASIFLFWPVIALTYRTTVAATSSPGFYARPTLGSFLLIMNNLLLTREERF